MKNKVLKIVGISIFCILFLVLSLYFLTSYNSIKVYNISLDSDKFILKSSTLVYSKVNNILSLGELKMKDDEYNRDNFYIELSIGNKFIVGSSSKTDLYPIINEYYGYEEYFNSETYSKVLDDFKIKIYVHKDYENRNNDVCIDDYEECDVYEYTLRVEELMRNNKLVYFKGKHF